MTNREENPWVHRFDGLDRGLIKSRLITNQKPLQNLHKLPLETACEELELALASVFIPTEQVVDLVEKIVGLGRAHSSIHYKSKRSFIRDCYSHEKPFPKEIFPYCLTGLAGIGKSVLLSSLQRVLPKPGEVEIDGYSNFPLDLLWHISIPGKLPISGLLARLLGNDFQKLHNKKMDIPELIDKCRWKAHMSGACIICIDESQFLTSSTTANAQIAELFRTFSHIGLPLIFSANYSLGHRLYRRPQEDRQRFLSNPWFLLPDTPNSDDWVDTVKGYKAVYPGGFGFIPEEDATLLHGWSAGNKRILKQLLVLSYRRSRGEGKSVSLSQIKSAFMSTEFSASRKDVNDMNELFITGRAASKDLECPFELPKSRIQALQEALKKERRANVSQSFIESTMSKGEQEIVEQMTKAVAEKPKADVSPIGGRKKRTVASLREAEDLI